MNPINASFRKPLYGAVSPGATMALHVDPPLDVTNERLFCVATRPSEVSFTIARPDTIVVQSKSTLPIAYGIAVLPNVVGPSDSLWQLVLGKVQEWKNRLTGNA